MSDPKERLEELRALINAEPPERGISQGEIAELESLAAHIEPDDVELLQWAGVPERAVVQNVNDPSLFWSNTTGWGSRAGADEFDVREQRALNLPDEGEWANADDYDRDAVDLFTQAMQDVERPDTPDEDEAALREGEAQWPDWREDQEAEAVNDEMATEFLLNHAASNHDVDEYDAIASSVGIGDEEYEPTEWLEGVHEQAVREVEA